MKPEAQRTDHWTTEQSRGVDVPAVQLTTRVKSSTLYGRTVVRSYGRTSKFFRVMGYYDIVWLWATLCERRYQYNINQMSDENKEKYQFLDN